VRNGQRLWSSRLQCERVAPTAAVHADGPAAAAATAATTAAATAAAAQRTA